MCVCVKDEFCLQARDGPTAKHVVMRHQDSYTAERGPEREREREREREGEREREERERQREKRERQRERERENSGAKFGVSRALN